MQASWTNARRLTRESDDGFQSTVAKFGLIAKGQTHESIVFSSGLLISSSANAQQCPQCSAADACIREYMRSATKIKADHARDIAAQRKAGDQTGSIDQGPSIQPDIDKLKDCLGKIRNKGTTREQSDSGI